MHIFMGTRTVTDAFNDPHILDPATPRHSANFQLQVPTNLQLMELLNVSEGQDRGAGKLSFTATVVCGGHVYQCAKAAC